MTTIVYSDTDIPFSEWKPAYVVLFIWEGVIPRSHWVPYNLWHIAKPEAEKLIDQLQKKNKLGEHIFPTCRWKESICEAIATVIRSNGVQVKIRYPHISEDHRRFFILTKK